MLRRELLKRDQVCLMQPVWLWLLITNLKGLVEVKAEITIKEVVVIKEEATILVLVVAIIPIPMVTSTTVIFLLHKINLSLVHRDLQGFKVKLKGHSVKSMGRMDMWLLIVTT